MAKKSLPEPSIRSHIVTVSSDGNRVGVGLMSHAAACPGPAECPYRDLDSLQEAVRAEGLEPGDYKVTGGSDHPTFEQVASPEEEPSPGPQDAEDIPDVYAIIDVDLPAPAEPEPFYPEQPPQRAPEPQP